MDLEAVDLRKGLTGLIAILVAGVFVVVFGMVGVIAGLAALFVIVTDQPGSLRARGIGALVMTGLGAVIAIPALWAGTGNVPIATLLTFAVTAAGTLAAGLGHSAAMRGLLLSVWAIVALSFGGEIEAAIQLTFAYVVGGFIAAVVIWLRSRALPEPTLEAQVEVASRRFEGLVRSSLGWYALLRATAVALAVAIGTTLFPAHPIWAAVTVIVVMRPRPGETVTVGVLRTVGTLIGVIAAESILALSGGGDAVILLGFLVAGFGTAAFGRVNYAVMIGFLTALLVFGSELVAGAGDSAAFDRLVETIVGAVIAFAAMAIGRWLLVRRAEQGRLVRTTDQASDGVDDVPG